MDLHAGPQSGAGCAERPAPQATYPGLTMATNRRDLAAVRAQAEEVEQMMTGDDKRQLGAFARGISLRLAQAHEAAAKAHADDPAAALKASHRAAQNVVWGAQQDPAGFMAEIEASRREVNERVLNYGQARSSAASPGPIASPLMPVAELLAKRRAMATGAE